MGASQKENFMRKMNKSKSKSPAHNGFNSSSMDDEPVRGSAVKMYNESDSVPAWYKALKKQVNK